MFTGRFSKVFDLLSGVQQRVIFHPSISLSKGFATFLLKKSMKGKRRSCKIFFEVSTLGISSLSARNRILIGS